MKSRILLILILFAVQASRGQHIFLAVANEIQEFLPDGESSVFETGLSAPTGLAFDGNGNLFVADYGINSVLEFYQGGGSAFYASNTVSGPEGMAFQGGYLYVANHWANDVERFNAAGQGSIFATVQAPTGIAFDSNGNLYVG